MRHLLSGALFFATLGTIVYVVVRLAQPGRQELELDLYVLLLGSIALATAVLAIREAFPTSNESGIAEALEVEAPAPVRPPDLERTERLLTMGTTTSFDFHFRLRPILREITEQRLADCRGLRLDAGGPEVEEALGEELWGLVRPDRPPPVNRYRADVDRATVQRAVERLESLT